MYKSLRASLLTCSILIVMPALGQAKMVTNSNAAHAQPPSQIQSKSQKLQTLAAKNAYIRRIYHATNQQLKSYTLTKIADDYQSTEGGEKRLYTQQGVLKKAEKHYLGETGNVLYQFYFDDNQLLFVFEKITNYNAPISYDTLQHGVEGFDINKSTFKENRYYFYDGQMIEWLDEHKNSVPNSSQRFKSKQKELLSAAVF